MQKNTHHNINSSVILTAIVLDKDVIPVLGVILEDSDLQDETSKEEDQSK